MATFEGRIQDHLDARISTLGKVKLRSLGADSLTLAALNVLVYAQLEGGVKDLAACVLRDVNARGMALGTIKPGLLKWRNPDELDRFRSMLNFDMVALPSPFNPILGKRIKVRGINRKVELNQMSWKAMKQVYSGLGLDYAYIEKSKAQIDDLVDYRNIAAHHGVLPPVATAFLERQVRENVVVVENVLIDLSIQLLPFFTNRLHMR
jgi:hypothetical protein